jgi:hypothetical protein
MSRFEASSVKQLAGINTRLSQITQDIFEELTAAEGQTVFTTQNSYTMGNSSIAVEIDGVPQFLGSGYNETSTNSITTTEGLPAGAKVKVIFHGLTPSQVNAGIGINDSSTNSTTQSWSASKINASLGAKVSQVNGVSPDPDGNVNVNNDWNTMINKPVIPPAYTLPAASANTLGGVMVGSGFSIDTNGILSTSSGGSTGVPMSSGLESNLTTLPIGTYYFCTDSYKVYFGTPVGNLFQGTATIATPPVNTGGGSTATPSVVFSDDFNRADSATTPGTSDSYSGGTNTAWVVDSGTLGISSNQLYTPNTTSCRMHIDAGVSDATFQLTVATVGNEHDFYFRLDPANPSQYLRYAYNTAGWFLQEYVSAFTTITSFPGTLNNGDVVSINCSGSVVTLSVNGTVINTANALTDLQTKTGFGIGFSGSAAGRIDNVKITSSSIPSTGGGTDTTPPVLTVTPSTNTTFTSTQSVTMSATDNVTPSPTIYYTTDGTDPKASATKQTYSAALNLSATTTVKAYAQDAAGNQSATQTIVYTLNGATTSTRPTNYILLSSYATGNGSDVTSSVQSCFNAAASAGKAVIVDTANGSTYGINTSNFGINVPSNITIWFDQGAQFKALANGSSNNASILRLLNTNNVNITGYPRLIGEWTGSSPNYETHMGIYMQSTSNTYIENANVSDCNGDGIYVGDATGTGQTYCLNTTLKNVICNHNSRNGISVISADTLTITSPTLTNNNGTLPMCGIDFEPNLSTERLANIVMTDPYIQNNSQEGIHFWMKNLGSYPISITITNMANVKNNGTGSVYYGGTTSTLKGFVKIDGTYYLNQ